MIGTARLCLAATGLIAALCVPGLSAAADTVIVYDASNSMWGRIQGEAKVLIARRVMADLVRDWDEGTPIGLVGYGHRRADDCTDIETVVPVGPVDREALIERIESLQPRGMTPLTDAVRHAAEELNYRDRPGTVVLISDGIESCDADPCAMAEELARAGIRFTAHVVGFDIPDGADPDQLRCIADHTGGQYFAARDAAGLQSALTRVTEMAAEPEPPAARVELVAPQSAVAGSKVEVAWSGEDIHRRDLVTIVPAAARDEARGDYARVGDRESTVLTAPGDPGQSQVRYVSSITGRTVARRDMELTPGAIALTAPDSLTAGAPLTVSWTGTVHPRDYITIVAADAADGEVGNYERAGNKTRTTLTAPGQPGDYEVRYVMQEDRSVLARTPVRLEHAGVEISAPGSVLAGAELVVEWDHSVHPRDFITIVPADAPPGERGGRGYYKRAGDRLRATLTVPGEPGDYEVRYVQQEDRRVLGRTPVRADDAAVELRAPERVTADASFQVAWHPTIHPRDYVTIVPVDAAEGKRGGRGHYKRASGRESATLVAPATPGAYEVRYVLNAGKRVLGRIPITVQAQ